MATPTPATSGDDPNVEALIGARQAVQLAREYITEITDRESLQVTAVAPTEQAGWLVELEVLENRRIPSTTDLLALYEVELDSYGELLAYKRTRRYSRAETGDGREIGGVLA